MPKPVSPFGLGFLTTYSINWWGVSFAFSNLDSAASWMSWTSGQSSTRKGFPPRDHLSSLLYLDTITSEDFVLCITILPSNSNWTFFGCDSVNVMFSLFVSSAFTSVVNSALSPVLGQRWDGPATTWQNMSREAKRRFLDSRTFLRIREVPRTKYVSPLLQLFSVMEKERSRTWAGWKLLKGKVRIINWVCVSFSQWWPYYESRLKLLTVSTDVTVILSRSQLKIDMENDSMHMRKSSHGGSVVLSRLN